MHPIYIYSPKNQNEVYVSWDYTHETFFEEDQAIKYLNTIKLDSKTPVVFRINFNSKNDQKKKLLHETPFMDVFHLNTYTTSISKTENKSFDLKYINPLIDESQALAHIEIIKDRIARGYFYQVNYTLPFKGELEFADSSAFEIFQSLRTNIAGDLHAFLPLSNDQFILSFSPEKFLEIKNGMIATEPIKGTAKRGLEKKLIESVKENAELSMIVDLLRNDLNSVCSSPVTVTKHRALMELSNLTHTYSRIEGITNKSIGEILKHTLPGGSISGCPKKESLMAIDELEPYGRGFYTGIVGIIHENQMQSSITIRSMLLNSNGEFFYHAGAGIVHESDPTSEYQEILLKAEALGKNPAWKN